MKAHEWLTREKWVQSRAGDGVTNGCLNTALAVTNDPNHFLDHTLAFYKQREGVVNTIEVLYPERIARIELRDTVGKLICFNDHYETTYEDVLRVLKVADV